MVWHPAGFFFGLVWASAVVVAVPYHPPSIDARDSNSQPICVPISPVLQNADDLLAKVTASCPKDQIQAPSTPTSPAPPGMVKFAAAAGGTYTCGKNKPCSNGSCCGKSGYCGFKEEYCGTNGESPNEVCWSNCDAHAECGAYAEPEGKECPLNVCCSRYGFCGMTEEFCKETDDPDTTCQSNCDQPGSGSSGGDVQKRIIGYYEAWNHKKKCIGMKIQDIPVGSLTHIYYSFGFIKPDTYDIIPMQGESEEVGTDTFTEFAGLKRKNPGVKAIMALGGWSFNNNDTIWQPVFGDLVSTEEKRSRFIGKVEDFLTEYGFDGVDIDWEYPGAPDRGGHEEDGENFTKLLEEMHAAFDKHEGREVSFTAPTSYWYMRHFDIKGSVEAANFVNLMAYDLHGVWDANNPIGSHVLAHTNLTEIDRALDLLWRNDIDAGKVNLGIGFYGRSFQLANPACYKPGCLFVGGASPGPCTDNSGTLSYQEIMDVIDKYDLTPYHDKKAAVKWVTWGGDQWVSFDDFDTFRQKIEFANSLGLGGLMIWAVDLDTVQLDALSALIYPESLGEKGAAASSANNWEDADQGECYRTECDTTGCDTGYIRIERSACSGTNLLGKYMTADICCPMASAPDPDKCTWRGTAPACNGRCHSGEVALASSYWGTGAKCLDGRKFFCCEATDAVPDCRWTGCDEDCSSSENELTWRYGLCPGGFSQRFCCSKEEEWKNCEWHGEPGSCYDDHCDTGRQVSLATSYWGEGETCGWHAERLRSFCCDPPDGSNPFLPVPLDYLFRNPPPEEEADTDFSLKVDPTWGGITDDPFVEDPDGSPFGFVVLTSDDKLQVSMDKRDGSHWEVFDCFDHRTEGEHTVRMMCNDLSENSNCGKIHLGHGVPGTILQMPPGCGPGKYAVAKSLEPSKNQSLPDHLTRRGLTTHDTVYDLTFDYDFKRVPRDEGPTHMRIDYSNDPNYWDKIVDQAANTKKRRKRSLHEVNGNHRRWMEEEWRDDAHFGALSKDDLHKRWFGSDIIDWLKKLIGTVSTEMEFGHSFSEDFVLKIVDQELNCPNVDAHLDVHADTHLEAKINYGFTLIGKLEDGGFDFSDSYLYFRSRGEATANFVVDGAVTAFFDTGDVKLFSADKFGAPFSVPGIVTIGPNFKLFGQLEGSATLGVNFESRIKLVDWDIQQTYPVLNDKWDPEASEKPSKEGTGEIMKPDFSYGLSLSGHLSAHIKPTISFGIEFDKGFIPIDDCAVNVVADGHITFHADGKTGSSGTSFCYGIDAGADLYATIDAPSAFSWALPQSPFPIIPIDDVQIYPPGNSPACWTPDGSKRSARSIRRSPNASLPLLDTGRESAIVDGSTHTLGKRAQVYGPLVPKLEGLSCPGNIDLSDIEPCPYCTSGSNDDTLAARDGAACWYDLDFRGTPCPSDGGNALEKRSGKKDLHWPGESDPIFVVNYPPCGKAIKNDRIKKWYGFKSNDPIMRCHATISKIADDKNHKSNYVTEHVYEAQSIKEFFLFLAGRKGSMPAGYTAGSLNWVSEVLIGLGRGSRKYSDPSWSGRTLWDQMARNIGSTQNPGGLVLADKGMNGKKGVFFADDVINSANEADIRKTKLSQRSTAGVFSYMRNSEVWTIFKESSQGMEQALHEFDKGYHWDSAKGAPTLPKRDDGQPAAGLRDLYCYWIDFELGRIETQARMWQPAAKTNFEQEFKAAGGHDATNWLKLFSVGGPLAQDQLRFKRANVAHSAPNKDNPDIWKESNYAGLWKTDNGYGAAGPF